MIPEDIAQQIEPPPYVKARFRRLRGKDAALFGGMIKFTKNGYIGMSKEKVHNADADDALKDEALLVWSEKVLNDGLPVLGQNPLAAIEDAGPRNHGTQSRENSSITTSVGSTSQSETQFEAVHKTYARHSLLAMPHKPNHIWDRAPADLKHRWVAEEKEFLLDYEHQVLADINRLGTAKSSGSTKIRKKRK